MRNVFFTRRLLGGMLRLTTGVFLFGLFFISCDKDELATSNADYKIISAQGDEVSIKVTAGRTIKSVEIVSDSKSYSYGKISIVSGKALMQLTNGKLDYFIFPEESVIITSGFDAPSGFSIKRVRITPGDGDAVDLGVP